MLETRLDSSVAGLVVGLAPFLTPGCGSRDGDSGGGATSSPHHGPATLPAEGSACAHVDVASPPTSPVDIHGDWCRNGCDLVHCNGKILLQLRGRMHLG